MKTFLTTMILTLSFQTLASVPCTKTEAVQVAEAFLKKEFSSSPIASFTKVYVAKNARLENALYTVTFALASQFDNGLDMQIGTLVIDPKSCNADYLKGDHTEEISL